MNLSDDDRRQMQAAFDAEIQAKASEIRSHLGPDPAKNVEHLIHHAAFYAALTDNLFGLLNGSHAREARDRKVHDEIQSILEERLQTTAQESHARVTAARSEGGKKALRDQAKLGATAKNAPTQKAKAGVRVYWDLWREQPTRYKNQKEFALDMLEKFEVLTSEANIGHWCREWKREVR
jgi:hypothetical protein